MTDAIKNRRSIRAFKDISVPRKVIEEIIHAGTLAPSSKNSQPWQFTVALGDSKREALDCMRRGLEREKERPFLTQSAPHISGAEFTLRIMEQAPVIVFVVNPLSKDLLLPLSPQERVGEICNVQSAGAAIENICLAATERGLGSLWICDTFFAYEELFAWLKTDGTFIAAVALGYADEKPESRPRREFSKTVRWRE